MVSVPAYFDYLAVSIHLNEQLLTQKLVSKDDKDVILLPEYYVLYVDTGYYVWLSIEITYSVDTFMKK